MEGLGSFLPEKIKSICLEKQGAIKGYAETISGVVIFADISGFTYLTEHIVKTSPNGVDIITKLLNKFFTPLINIIKTYNGQIIQYVGDAIQFYIPQIDCSVKANILESIDCSMEILSYIKKHRIIEIGGIQFDIDIKIGLSYGIIKLHIINDGKKYIPVFYGEPLIISSKAKERCGEHKISIPLKDILSLDNEIKYKTKGKYAILEQFRSSYQSLITPKTNVIDNISPFFNKLFDENIMKLLKSDKIVINEKRRVGIIIVKLYDIDETNNIYKFEDYICRVRKIADMYNIYFSKVDIGDKGYTLMFISGIPDAMENIEYVSVCFAYRIADFNLTQKVLINSGFVFSGEIGSERRKDFTIIGDEANNSGKIIRFLDHKGVFITKNVKNKVKKDFKIKQYRKYNFKEEQYPIDVFKVVSQYSQTVIDTLYNNPQDFKRKIIERIISSVKDKNKYIHIYGQAGTGKSYIISQIIYEINIKNISVIKIKNFSFEKDVTYSLLRRLLSEIAKEFKINDLLSANNIKSFVNGIIGSDKPQYRMFIYFIGLLFNVTVKNVSSIIIVDGSESFNILLDILCRAIESLKSAKLMLIIDDVFYSDNASIKIIKTLLKKIKSIKIIFSSRRKGDVLYFSKDTKQFEIKNFNKKETKFFIENILTGQNIAEKVIGKLFRYTLGNPLFISETIKLLFENNLLIYNIEHNRVIDILLERVPERINDLIAYKLNNFDYITIRFLKIIAVIGDEIKIEFVEKILLNFFDKNEINNHLDKLTEKRIIKKVDIHTYVFETPLIKEVIYNGIFEDFKNTIHYMVAIEIEKESDTSLNINAELLYYHFYSAGVYDKAYKYAILAGDYDWSVFNSNASLDYYLKAFKLAKSENDIDNQIVSLKRVINAYIYLNRFNKANIMLEILEMFSDKYRDNDIDYFIKKSMVKIYLKKREIEKSLDILMNTRKKYLNNKYISGEINLLLGEAFNKSYNYKKALSYIDKAIKCFRKYNNREKSAKAFVIKGDILSNLNKYKKSNCFYELAGNIFYELGKKDKIIDVLINRGVQSELMGDYKDAFGFYTKSAKQSRDIGYYEGEIDSYMNSGIVKRKMGDFSNAIKFYEKGYLLSKEFGLEHNIIKFLTNLSLLYDSKGDYSQSIKYAKQSLKMLLKTKDSHGIANLYNNIGTIYWHLSKYNRALDNYKKSLSMFKEINDIPSIAPVSHNIGLLEMSMGNMTEAIKLFKDSYNIYMEENNYTYVISTLKSMGLLYLRKGDFAKSQRYYKNALQYVHRTDDRFEILGLYIGISSLYLETGNLQKAYYYIRRTIAMLKNPRLNWYKGYIYLNVLQYHCRKRNHYFIKKYIGKFIESPELLGDKELMCRYLIMIGKIKMDYDKIVLHKSVDEILEETIKIAKKNNLLFFEAEAYYHLAMFRKREGDIEVFKENLKKSLEIYKVIGNKKKVKLIKKYI